MSFIWEGEKPALLCYHVKDFTSTRDSRVRDFISTRNNVNSYVEDFILIRNDTDLQYISEYKSYFT